MIMNIENPEQLADFLAPNLNIEVAQKQALLEELDVEKRVRAVQEHVSAQLEIAQIQQRLQKDVASQFSDAQRRAYLRSQLKAIQHELGETEGGSEEQAQQLRVRLQEANPPEAVMKQAERVIKRKAADMAALTAARCRAGSFRSCAAAARAILFLCSTRSTKSARIFVVTRRARCSKCSIRHKIMPSSIATSTCLSIFRKSFLSARPITSRGYPNRCGTASK